MLAQLNTLVLLQESLDKVSTLRYTNKVVKIGV